MYNDPGPWTEHRYQVLKDLNAILVRPVVEDGSEEIYVYDDGLGSEEVTSNSL